MEKHAEIDAYIARLNLAYKAEFVPQSKSRNAGEKSRSINWVVFIAPESQKDAMPARGIKTDYMQGIGHIPRYQEIVGWNPRKTVALEEFEKFASELGRAAPNLESRFGHPLKPPALRDVLYSLVQDSDVLNHDSFESWASELGYDTDSRQAEKTYNDCMKIALKLCAMIGNVALDGLRDVFTDY